MKRILNTQVTLACLAAQRLSQHPQVITIGTPTLRFNGQTKHKQRDPHHAGKPQHGRQSVPKTQR